VVNPWVNREFSPDVVILVKGDAMKTIAVIPGDGIGKEVIPVGMRVVDAAGKKFGFEIKWNILPWNTQYYHAHGKMMPDDWFETLTGHDAIYLGAVGDPSVPENVPVWGLVLPIRRRLRQYANIRPVRLLRGVKGHIAEFKSGQIDMVIVRENNEGEYSTIGGRQYEGTEDEIAIQTAVFTRKGIEKIVRYSFELARKRRKHVSSATKSNALLFSMVFWDEVFRSVADEYPDVEADQYHVDNMCAQFVLHPERFDVVVGSNLFGDILSDLAPATVGSLGIAASANLNPDGDFPSLFEPVHGSAPDIAGKGIANPVGTIWSASMMLDHLGYSDAAKDVEKAVEEIIGDKGIKTPDLGGTATTEEVGNAVIAAL
jgi:tartrate dehydrogenase/decarboxylase / D-malate dehydrogenase